MNALASQSVNQPFPTHEISHAPVTTPKDNAPTTYNGSVSFWNLLFLALAIFGVVFPLVGGLFYLPACLLTVPLIIRTTVLTIRAYRLDLDVTANNDVLMTIDQEINK